MFKVPFILSLALLASSCFRTPATPVQITQASLIRISGISEEHTVTCSGFVIGHEKVLTANHCIEDVKNLTYDGKKGHIMFRDMYYDLALIEVETKKPSLQLEDADVTEGQNLTAIGYANGWGHLLVLSEIVRIPNYPVEPEVASGIVMQGGIIGGMSGGPIINEAGRVVGVCQRAKEVTGYGVSVTTIKAFLRDAEGHREAFQGLAPITSSSSSPKVELSVTPRFGLSAPMTVRTTIRTTPTDEDRGLCLQWDSDTGEGGTHCFTREGANSAKTVQWDLLIHSSGEYAIQAILIRVSDVLRSVVQTVIIQGM